MYSPSLQAPLRHPIHEMYQERDRGGRPGLGTSLAIRFSLIPLENTEVQGRNPLQLRDSAGLSPASPFQPWHPDHGHLWRQIFGCGPSVMPIAGHVNIRGTWACCPVLGTYSHTSGSSRAIPAPGLPGRKLLSTIHCRWTVGPFRTSLVRGDSPRNAPLQLCRRAYASPARLSATGRQCHRACAEPAGVSKPARVCHRACAIPACRRRAADATPARVRGSRSSNHKSQITSHGRSGRSGRSGPPLSGGTPPATPPCSYAALRARFQLMWQRKRR